MLLVAKPPAFSAYPTYALGPAELGPGMVLDVGPGESAVLLRGQLVAGVLGPGRHPLDPNVYPWLWKLADASGRLTTEILFVTLGSFGATSFEGRIASALEGAVSEALRAGWQAQHLGAQPGQLLHRLSELARIEPPPPPPPPPAAPARSVSSEPVYEMLWDCRHCGSNKLLGLTHRHCPQCGAPQNPSERYFPSDDEKVAVQNHVYYGADRLCRYCQNPNSQSSKHCGTCGGPLEEGSDVARRAEQVHAIGAYAGESAQDARRELTNQPVATPRAPKRNSRVRLVVGLVLGFLFALLALFVVAVVWTKPAGLEVKGHEWKREIDVERFGPVQETAWCDQVPSGGRVTGRSRAVRSHERVQKGETCRTKKVDQGDGTFRESRVCEPVYQDKPIYSDECRYTIDKWTLARTATKSGASLSPPPSWPEPGLARAGQCLGCEREARRRETYSVELVDTESKDSSTCKFEQAKWQSFAVGSRWQGEVGVLVGNLDCSSLARR
jgi:hypothetical protein